jgi:hypothetical protein
MKNALLQCLKLASVPALTALAFNATGADLPKSGKLTGKFGWYAIGKTVEIEKDHYFWTGEFNGTFFSDTSGGPMDLTSVVCPAMQDVKNGKAFAHGYCVVTDTSGDKAYLSWKCSGTFGDKCNGEFQWTGGTGKYTGIKGNNKFYGVTLLPTASGYSVWDGGWELP